MGVMKCCSRELFSFCCLLVCQVFFTHSIAGLTNVALNKPAQQSSYQGDYGRPDQVVDGNRGTHISQCTQTEASDPSPEKWWRVDLEATVEVHTIVITNRGDCCGSRLANFDVEVAHFLHDPEESYQDDSISNLCLHHNWPIPSGATVALNCTRPTVGRHVTLIQPSPTEPLHVCEVEVLARPIVLGQKVTTYRKQAAGQRAVGGIIVEMHVRSVLHCSAMCAQVPGCTAINVQTSGHARRLCQLVAFGGRNHPSTLLSSLAWNFYHWQTTSYP